jgi:hypothetical protein
MSRSRQTTKIRRQEPRKDEISEGKLVGLVQIYQELLGRAVGSEKQLTKMGMPKLKQLAQKLRGELYGEPDARRK